MNFLAYLTTTLNSLFGQVNSEAPSNDTSAVVVFVLALLGAIFVNIGKQKAISSKVKIAFRVSDANWGAMFGTFVFAVLLGSLPNLFGDFNAIGAFRYIALILAVFTGLYLICRVIAEGRRINAPEQAWRLSIIATSVIFGVLYVMSAVQNDRIKGGVDLAGGVNLIYSINFQSMSDGSSETQDNLSSDDMDALLGALGRRLNPSGAKDLILRPYGNNTHVEIVVPRADTAEINQLKEIITNTGALEFLILASKTEHQALAVRAQDTYQLKTDLVKATAVADDVAETLGIWVSVSRDGDGQFEYNASGGNLIRRVTYLNPDNEEKRILVIDIDGSGVGQEDEAVVRAAFRGAEDERQFNDQMESAGVTEVEVLMASPPSRERTTGDDLSSVRSDFDQQTGSPCVSFMMNSGGARKFGTFTANNIDNLLGIVLDRKLLSAATINSRISDSGQITGRFTQKDVDFLVGILRAGKLPGTLTKIPESENVMGAALGTATIKAGKNAIMISFLAVLIFIIGYYLWIPGTIAAFALVFNVVLIIAAMAMIGASFTLPGMAGLVLTVGMSVDANVLIFERIREELAEGSKIRQAIRNGFSRATITIIDANLTTLITAVLLYAIGTDQIRGFAITLILGIIMSMFTAIYASRGLFEISERVGMLKDSTWAFRGFRIIRRDIDFLGMRKIMGFASLIVVIAAITVTASRGRQMLAIDLAGGTSAIFSLSDQNATAGDVEDKIADAAEKKKIENVQLTVTSIELSGDRSGWRVDASIENQNDLEAILNEAFQGQLPTQRFQVSDTVSSIGAVETEPSSRREFVAGNDRGYHLVSYQDQPAAEENPAAESIGPTVPAPDLPDPAIIDPLPEEPESQSRISFSIETSIESQSGGESDSIYALNSETLLGMISEAARSSNIEGVSDANVELSYRTSSTAAWMLASSDQEQLGDYNQWKIEITGITGADADLIKEKLQSNDGLAYFHQTQKFGPQIAGDMQMLALTAMLFSFAGIITYIWLRFQHVTFGIAAVVALLHDVLVTLAAMALSFYVADALGVLLIEDFKISLPVIAAFLTIIGYSLNDTIVVFDRIREVRGKSHDLTDVMLNKSINQTLNRTLLTSVTTLIVVLVLYVFGGSGIHGFAFALVVGVIAGTYSSIFIAAPTLLVLHRIVGKKRDA